jgi:hypothetical protein
MILNNKMLGMQRKLVKDAKVDAVLCLQVCPEHDMTGSAQRKNPFDGSER